MKRRMNRCPHCGGEIGHIRTEVHFINPDGCRTWNVDPNLRTRDTIGYGPGSLADEALNGIETPWTSASHKKAALAALSGSERAFAKRLPYVQVDDAED